MDESGQREIIKVEVNYQSSHTIIKDTEKEQN